MKSTGAITDVPGIKVGVARAPTRELLRREKEMNGATH